MQSSVRVALLRRSVPTTPVSVYQQRRSFLGSFFGGGNKSTSTTSSSSSASSTPSSSAGKSSWPFGGRAETTTTTTTSVSSSNAAARAAGEQLVDAGLALLDHARANDKYSSEEMHHIDNLLQIVFVSDNTSGGSDAQTLSSLPQQFEAAAEAYIAFHSSTHQDAAKIALVVMESFVPFEVGNMFQFVDWGVFSEEEQLQLILFTKAVLGGEEELGEAAAAILGKEACHAPEEGDVSSTTTTTTSISKLAHHLREVSVPKIDAYTSITKFLESSESIHLNAQLVVLLGRLMQVFDPEGTGRVALHEVEESLKRVTGEVEAERLLAGLRESAQVDDKPQGEGAEAVPFITYATLLRMIQTSSKPSSTAGATPAH